MWKPEHRLPADRRGLRYPSDLPDAEWAIVAAMIPPGRHGGRRRSVNVREVLNGIFYVLWTGCQWKALPRDTSAEEHGARGYGQSQLKDPVNPFAAENRRVQVTNAADK